MPGPFEQYQFKNREEVEGEIAVVCARIRALKRKYEAIKEAIENMEKFLETLNQKLKEFEHAGTV